MPQVDPFAPNLALQLGGNPLPIEARLDMVAMTVEEDVDAPGMFTFQLNNWDADQNAPRWSDNVMFAVGGEVAISVADADDDPLMTGEITGLEPEFSGGVCLLTIRGYDRRHRLLRARRTRSFTSVKDSDIASQLADDAGLTAEVTDSAVVHEYLFQNNLSDLEFLEIRARASGNEVTVVGKTLYFRPRPLAEKESLSLSLKDDLIEFHPRLSALSQFSSVALRGWDPATKDSVQSQSGDGDELAVLGDSSGPASAKKAFSEAQTAIAGRPVRSQPEGDALTRSLYNEMALDYITGEGICVGRSDLRAGKVVRLTGFGTRFSGLYYVTATAHSWNTRDGYRTGFTVRRNAS